MICKEITLEVLKECMNKHISPKIFDISKSLEDHGLDDLDMVELCMYIEKKLDIAINDDEWLEFCSSENFFFLVERQRNEKINMLGI